MFFLFKFFLIFSLFLIHWFLNCQIICCFTICVIFINLYNFFFVLFASVFIVINVFFYFFLDFNFEGEKKRIATHFFNDVETHDLKSLMKIN